MNFGVTSSGDGITLTNLNAAFGMGSGTGGDFITFLIYDGLGGTGNVLWSKTMSATNFGNSFNTYDIAMGTNLTLGSGAYSFVIKSTASGTGNDSMYYKESALSLAGSNGSTLSSLYWIQDTNTTGTATTNFSAPYVLADYKLSTTNLSLGNYRFGAGGTNASSSVSLSNSAISTTNNATEKLSAVATASGNASVSGVSTSNLIAVTGNTNFTVGLTINQAGTNSGTVALNYTSLTNGTASARTGGATNVGSNSVNVSAVGYRMAQAGFASTNVNLGNTHVGQAFSNAALTISNTSAAGTYTENLGADVNSTSNGATASGGFTSVGGGSSSTAVTVGLTNTGTAGAKSGTVLLDLATREVNGSGLGVASIGSQAVTVTGAVFNYAAAGLSSSNINLGNIHVGGSFGISALSIGNTAAPGAYTEGLDVSVSSVSGSALTNGASISNLAGGSNSTAIAVGLGGTSSAGAKSGTVTLGLVSSGVNSGLANTGLGSQVVNVTGKVYSYAAATLASSNINLGNIHEGQSFGTSALNLSNSAADTGGYTETLGASVGSASGGVSGSGSVTGLGAGSSSNGLSVTFTDNTAGAKSGSVALNLTSQEVGSSGLGNTSLGSQNVNVSGKVYRLAAASLAANGIDLGKIHEGGAFGSGSITLSNGAAASGGYTETLGASVASTSGGASASGSVSGLGAGSSTSGISATLTDNTAGAKNGKVSLAFVSQEIGNSGLGHTSLSGQDVNVTGFVYTGRSLWNIASGGTWSNFDHWDLNGGKPGVDGVLSVNDTATFGAGPTSGSTEVTLDGAAPVLTALTFSNASSSYTVAKGSGNSGVTLGTAYAAGVIKNDSGNHTIASSVQLARDTTVTVSNAGEKLTVSGAVSGANGLVKNGLGRLNLTGTNDYTGSTTVGSGLLSVNGTLTTSTVTVENTGVLGGSGTIGGAATIQAGGTLSPGNSPGVLTFTNGLTLASGSSVIWELTANTDSPDQRGVTYDGINVTGGNLTIDSNVALNLSFTYSGSIVLWSDPFWSTNHTWTLISFTSDGLVQTPSEIIAALYVGTDSAGKLLADVRTGYGFSVSRDGNNVMLNYTAVPEPSTYALFGLGGLLLLVAFRRRTA